MHRGLATLNSISTTYKSSSKKVLNAIYHCRKQMKSGQASIVTGSEAEPQKLKHFLVCLHFLLRMTGKELLCIFL